MSATMDIQKLTKLMNLTLSDNDHEALNALRMANKIVRDNGQMWNSMLKCPGEKFCTHAKPVPPPVAPVWRPAATPDRNIVTIVEMIDELLMEHTLNSGTRKFIEDLEEFYDEHGRLSDKQYSVLRNIYETTAHR